jgi:hypothetical protein
MADKEKLNLHQKILEVMKAIEYLKKDDSVEYKTTKYKAMSEEKVTTTVRAELIKQGIVVFPIEQSVEKDGNITTTNTKYRMVNVDDPLDYIDLASSGQGADTQDKGVGKAMTYSFKYMLLRTFAIPTGEDPDKIASEKIDDDTAVAEIKRLIMETDTDTTVFLVAMSKKFKREVTSVDDMIGKTYRQGSVDAKELDYALMRLKEKKGEK